MRTASFRLFAAVSLLTWLEAAAGAVCYYKGEWDKQTTLDEEYADSKWVVRARVLSAVDGTVEPGKPDTGMPWTVYRLKVVERFKGRLPTEIKYFTERNSGGFYMDRPWVPLPKGHDVGGEYLLFLSPIEPHTDRPRAARAATFVNYNCGQSRSWIEVDQPSRNLLRTMAKSN